MGCGRGKKVSVPWTEFESQTFDLVIESTPESSVNVRGIASYREFGSSEVESPKSKRISFSTKILYKRIKPFSTQATVAKPT